MQELNLQLVFFIGNLYPEFIIEDRTLSFDSLTEASANPTIVKTRESSFQHLLLQILYLHLCL